MICFCLFSFCIIIDCMHVCAAKLCRCLSAEHIYDDVVQLAHVSPTRQCALLQPSFPATLHTPDEERRRGGGTAAVAARVVLARAGSQLAGTRAGRVTTGVSSSLLFLAGRPVEPLCWPWRSWRPPRSCVTVAVKQQSVRLDPNFFFHFFGLVLSPDQKKGL